MFQSVFLPVGILACIILLLSYIKAYFRRSLQSLPGPVLARFSGLYRLSLVQNGRAPERYRELHESYGPIVRTGPNHVSISDVSMIPVIYGIGSKFLKVISPHLCERPQINSITDAFLHNNGPNLQGHCYGESLHNS